MSAWRPCKTATGGLPNISFIPHKHEPLSTFKIEKSFMMQFNNAIGVTAGCTLRSLLETIPNQENQEKDTKFGIRGDAWFGSVKTSMRWG
jgi:hypothetical protein